MHYSLARWHFRFDLFSFIRRARTTSTHITLVTPMQISAGFSKSQLAISKVIPAIIRPKGLRYEACESSQTQFTIVMLSYVDMTGVFAPYWDDRNQQFFLRKNPTLEVRILTQEGLLVMSPVEHRNMRKEIIKLSPYPAKMLY